MSESAENAKAVRAGFLIVKSYERMYREFTQPISSGEPSVYSIPRADCGPEQMAKRYRGMSRDPLQAWSADDLRLGFPHVPFPTEPDACLLLHELEENGRGEDDFIFTLDSAEAVWSRLRAPGEWEMIWACKVAAEQKCQSGATLLGYEPTWFIGDHFSAIMDSMCFPRWHGPDPDYRTLQVFHDRLNVHGLFNTAAEAVEFQDFYEAQTWAETGPFFVAEIQLIHGTG